MKTLKITSFIVAVIAIMTMMTVTVQGAERVFKDGTITVPIGSTAVTNLVVLPANPGSELFMTVSRVVASVSSGGGTGVVTFSVFDLDKLTTIATSPSITTASALYSYMPMYEYTYSEIVNSYASTTTNLTATAVVATNTVSLFKQYPVRFMKVIATQSAANPTATVYKYAIFAE